MKSWTGIEELVAVSEYGSFTRAAKALGVSIAQVSRHIAELEQSLNLKLLYRTTRSVSFTEEGQVYLQHCRHLVDSLEEANRAISSFQLTPRGQLKITAPVYYGETRIAPLLFKFMRQFPEVSLDLNLTNEQLDLVQGGYDLAIRLGTLASSSLIAKKLTTRKQYIVGSPAYLEQYGTPLSVKDLEQHSCLHGSLGYWRVSSKQHNQIQVKGKQNIRCNSGIALVEAALEGMGLAQLPDYYVEQHIKSGKLVPLLEENRVAEDGIWAVYPQNRHLSAKVRQLVDFLSDEL
ncbi:MULTISPECIES: LysR substrate-binding domain-containing protein [Gammaproteobacteria]|uniref:LysR substrate-binding domain-containing protein n=1 Tax=Gammaproteobacteria TaxID=1236 RepID=UPI000DD0BD0B|nr:MULTISPECIES: LysR substrate-binding domain-containing protein [Gammaproteobacteria]RTE87062.1 LysR family transcriptional regulator [Aliidiomarina sp. B3213]TCZ93148.1 LysR family transcriptional regulator [Lysobacter sp. N42]